MFSEYIPSNNHQKEPTLRYSHPIFANTLERTVRKLFPSIQEFCKETGISPEHYDAMMQIESSGSTLRLDTLTSMLKAINKRSSMAYSALLHFLLEDIEEAVDEPAGLED
jgi:predicted transcriptional regulator